MNRQFFSPRDNYFQEFTSSIVSFANFSVVCSFELEHYKSEMSKSTGLQDCTLASNMYQKFVVRRHPKTCSSEMEAYSCKHIKYIWQSEWYEHKQQYYIQFGAYLEPAVSDKPCCGIYRPYINESWAYWFFPRCIHERTDIIHITDVLSLSIFTPACDAQTIGFSIRNGISSFHVRCTCTAIFEPKKNMHVFSQGPSRKPPCTVDDAVLEIDDFDCITLIVELQMLQAAKVSGSFPYHNSRACKWHR